jgi:hypothetical protein
MLDHKNKMNLIKMAWYYVVLALVVLSNTIAGVLIWWFFIRGKSSNSVTDVCTFASGTTSTLFIPSGTTFPGPGWFYVPNLDPKTGDGYTNSINPGSWIYVVDANNKPVTAGPACVGTPPTVPPAGTLLGYVGSNNIDNLVYNHKN